VYAMVTNVRIDGSPNETAQQINERVIPAVKELGAVAGYWARSGDGTRGGSMVIFETEEAAQAAADTIRDRAPDNVTFEWVEVREIIAQL
jgi:hypothetical protein